MTMKASATWRAMKFGRIITLTVSLLALSGMAVVTPATLENPTKGNSPERHLTSVLVRSDRPVGHHLFDSWYVVEIATDSGTQAVLEAERLPGVLHAEPDAPLKMHQTACPPAEWYIENFGQFGDSNSVDVDTDAWEAWAILRTLPTLTPIRIAVIDSGVNIFHSRFKDVKFYTRQKFVNDNRSIGDVYGHGTAVAGVITAMLPDPSWYEMGSYRVYDEYGGAAYSHLIAGMVAACADGAKIINISGGGTDSSEALLTFLASHPEVLFVVSAGNRRGDSNCPDCGQEPDYPARYHDLPNVISVAAIEQSGALTSRTNLGALLAAPGQYIFTSMTGCDTEPITICQPARYGFLEGTSYSAAIVSGVCAGRMLMHPEESTARVREKLLSSVDVSRLYRGNLVSSGRVNFQKLIEMR